MRCFIVVDDVYEYEYEYEYEKNDFKSKSSSVISVFQICIDMGRQIVLSLSLFFLSFLLPSSPSSFSLLLRILFYL